MERSSYAAILFFVLGIIEVYSFPQGTDLTANAIAKEIFEDEPHYDSSSQVLILDHEYAGRIRRDGGGLKQPSQNDRESRVLDLARRTREEESRQEAIRERVRAHQAAEEQFEATLDRYMQQGLNRPAAIDRIRRRNPTLANQFIPSTNAALL